MMLEVRDRKCREHFGEDVWESAEPKAKACFDFLCGKHTRNLPVVRFNKVHNTFLFNLLTVILVVTLPEPFKAYEKWIQTELGDALRVAKMATGTKPDVVTRYPDTDANPSPEC